MNELTEHLVNSSMQRSGLMAVIVGVLMTSEDEATVETVCRITEDVIKQIPVGDEIETRALGEIEEARARIRVAQLIKMN